MNNKIAGYTALERLEPCAGKLACTVLGGADNSNVVSLLDFAFVGRQKRLTFDNDHYYVDLVFYHVILKYYVIIHLKRHKLTHADLGQMQLYVNYFDQEIKMENDNPTIGIVLCTTKSENMVKYMLGEKAKQIFASTYQFHFPTEKELETKLKRELEEIVVNEDNKNSFY